MTKKIGRNEQCPCGSGKKYKHCHGKYAAPPQQLPPEVAEFFDRTIREQQATEKIRQQQQGYGRPIISFENNGYRMVAVKNRIFYSKTWAVFFDFLLHFLKDQLGFEWGKRETAKSLGAHPLIGWLARFGAYQKKFASGGGKVKSGPMTGFIASIFHLAYALYLLAHHDQVPKRLLRRLRNQETFYPAYYETLVGSVLAVAGFQIRCEETGPSAKPTPEFTARASSGKIYNVEAKRKNSWAVSTTNIETPEFRDELERYIRDQLYHSSRKRFENAVFWIELSIPTLTLETQWKVVAAIASKVLRRAETEIKIDGDAPLPAYVIITNHTYLANADISGAPVFALLESFIIPDFIPQGSADIERALSAYDRHREIVWMMDCMKVANNLPASFDGTPGDLLDDNGRPTPTIKIGDRLLFPNSAGIERPTTLEEITMTGDKAWVIVKDDETAKRWISTVPLSEGEKRANEQYGEAIFGKLTGSRRLRENDPFDLYDWLREVYAHTSRENLLKLLEKHPQLEELSRLDTDALRVRICREYTKSMFVRSANKEA